MVAITYFNVFKSKSYIHISMEQQLVKTKTALSLKEDKGRCKEGLQERENRRKELLISKKRNILK